MDAPRGKDKIVPVTAEISKHLAYYKSQNGIGVLAPRGWHCFGTYGSSGATTYVSPEPIDGTTVFSSEWHGFSGNVIQISSSIGDTSGRFVVAEIIARVFPAHKSFVENVIQEGIEPASSFPSGPYPNDKLSYKSSEIVEYETPAQTEGLGTRSRLQKNAQPIVGAEILAGETPDLVSVALRLPAGQSSLMPIIIQQVEKDANSSQQE